MIDYRELLKKYMEIVSMNEGTTFVPTYPIDFVSQYGVVLTKEEQDALIAISDMVEHD